MLNFVLTKKSQHFLFGRIMRQFIQGILGTNFMNVCGGYFNDNLQRFWLFVAASVATLVLESSINSLSSNFLRLQHKAFTF